MSWTRHAPGIFTSARRVTLRNGRLPTLTRSQSGPGLENMMDAPENALMISSITSAGLELSDGLVVPGPCIILNGRVFLWNVPSSQWIGWTKEHFEIFEVVVPKPEILMFGTGPNVSQLPTSLRRYLNGLGMQVDIMDTRNASSTYNLLLEEGRRVAAALLPMNASRPWRSK